MREHESKILNDEYKQILIQFELSRAKRIQNTLNKDLLKGAISKPYKLPYKLHSWNRSIFNDNRQNNCCNDHTLIQSREGSQNGLTKRLHVFIAERFVETSDKATSLQSFMPEPPKPLCKLVTVSSASTKQEQMGAPCEEVNNYGNNQIYVLPLGQLFPGGFQKARDIGSRG